MARPRLPRRKVTSYGQKREAIKPGARYTFAVDILACGHEIYFDDERPASRGCADCYKGLPAGFHPHEIYTGDDVPCPACAAA